MGDLRGGYRPRRGHTDSTSLKGCCRCRCALRIPASHSPMVPRSARRSTAAVRALGATSRLLGGASCGLLSPSEDGPLSFRPTVLLLTGGPMPDATVTHTLPGRAAKASEALPYALSVRMSTGQRAFLQPID